MSGGRDGEPCASMTEAELRGWWRGVRDGRTRATAGEIADALDRAFAIMEARDHGR